VILVASASTLEAFLKLASRLVGQPVALVPVDEGRSRITTPTGSLVGFHVSREAKGFCLVKGEIA
jgi:hypothetical protein